MRRPSERIFVVHFADRWSMLSSGSLNQLLQIGSRVALQPLSKGLGLGRRYRSDGPLLRRRACGCAAEQRDELAPLHSITSSARISNDAGIVRPSVLAVLRLIVSLNRVGCMAGRSAGFAPWRI